ncbi:MAG: type A chloramphenicol O-acetyltransferase [Clostridia bacterium]|nr:type A chloramphenicol O-acetyltransferase [Clostridia bacterium]
MELENISNFKKIDLDNWKRKHYYDYFMNKENKMRCRFGMTANIDITNLLHVIKSNKLRCYPTFTYLVSKVLNSHECFKVDEYNGELIVWDKLHVRYPMFNEDTKTITSIWLEYDDDFNVFYKNALKDIEKYSGIQSMYAKENFPPNFYDITSIPWVSFTDFQIDMYGTNGKWIMPLVAIGKFFERDNKILIPISIKLHHATCDGYHAGIFYNELQNLAFNFIL